LEKYFLRMGIGLKYLWRARVLHFGVKGVYLSGCVTHCILFTFGVKEEISEQKLNLTAAKSLCAYCSSLFLCPLAVIKRSVGLKKLKLMYVCIRASCFDKGGPSSELESLNLTCCFLSFLYVTLCTEWSNLDWFKKFAAFSSVLVHLSWKRGDTIVNMMRGWNGLMSEYSAFVNSLMKLQFLQKAENFSASWLIVSFSRNILLHWVR
jgi:hypothetical protein